MMVAVSVSNSPTETLVKQAEAIVPVQKQEAAQIATVELQQVLNLLEQLSGDDWMQPTDCTEWCVQDMTAHLAGGCAGWASLKHFLSQTILNPHLRKMDVPINAINRRELEDRADKTPQQLIDELREVGPKAIRTRCNLPEFLRKIRIDAKPMAMKITVAYLVDVIYPRDQWMHRMDICRATGKTWASNPDHDQRLLDLVMLDMAKTTSARHAVRINVTGALNATYRFGSGDPHAEIDIDLFALNRRASARITPDETLELVQIRGDQAIARDFLRNCEVLY
ncbi:MAG: maleylpyruvate isomerase family mycothiol-dependent enzyme [Anaerolineae bacterium]|nr:maleylpyruvate isomerase family mycothiol-dependent enzyme [Anaerolineae bacterium]